MPIGAWNSELWQQLAGLASWLTQVHSLVILWFLKMLSRGAEKAGQVAGAGRSTGEQRVSLCRYHSLLFPGAAFLREGHSEPAWKRNKCCLYTERPGSLVACPPSTSFPFPN